MLVEGTLLALHRRTISAALRAAGQDGSPGFACYHRVLNKARWSARAAPGGETQRQWPDPAIARTTPVLLGLYSLVTLWADDLCPSRALLPLTAAWHAKKRVTFSDVLASIRRALWAEAASPTSRRRRDLVEIPRPVLNRPTTLACYAA